VGEASVEIAAHYFGNAPGCELSRAIEQFWAMIDHAASLPVIEAAQIRLIAHNSPRCVIS